MILEILYTLFYSISIFGILALGLLVFLQRRGKVNLHFTYFCIAVGLWLLFQFAAQLLYQAWPQGVDWLLRAALASSMFMGFFLFTFVSFHTRRNPHTFIAIIPPALAALLSFIPGASIIGSVADYTGITVSGTPLYYIQLTIPMAYAAVGIWYLLADIRRNKFASQRQRSLLLLGSILQAGLVSVVLVTIFQDVAVAQIFIPISLFIMVIVLAYGIVRHRLFDVRLLVVRSIAYALSLSLLAALYTLLTLGVVLVFANNLTKLAQQVNLILVVLLATTFGPLKRFFDKLTRRLFYRDAYDAQAVIDKIDATIVRTVVVEDLVLRCLEVIKDTFRPEFSYAILRANSHPKPRVITTGRPLDEPDGLLHAIKGWREPLLFQDDVAVENSPRLQKALWDRDISLLARMDASRDRIGYLVLGNKASGGAYSTNDASLLRTIADVMAVAIQNASRFEQIQRFNVTLQKEVEDATAELRATNKKLKALDEAKDEFISMASHQLRTPLTSVKGYLSMALEGDGGRLNTDQRHLLDEAYSSAQRMVYMIADLLNVSRLQTGKFVLEPGMVDLTGLIHEEVEQLEAAAKARGLTVVLHVPSQFPAIPVDENKVRQVIMNFLDNAIFYSKSGGTITVTLDKTQYHAVFTVEDTGIGVPASEQTHLFTKFFRASNARGARPDGTGIGLFVAKKVIDAHHGTLIFTSQENKGSTFGFTLPLKGAIKQQEMD
jgi:signal transduction histidine kinase